MANSVDPDQTAPKGAVCSGSTLFASILNLSVMLGNYLQQTTSADNIFRWIFIPRRSRRDIVLAASVRPSGTISQYLLVRFDSFLVQMISTINSRYPISLVKIDPLTLELLPLFKYRQL